MQRPGALAVVVAAAAMLPAAGPADARAKADYAQQCQTEVRPKGYYTYTAGRKVPVVTPAQGGTQAEADALNACIRAKAAGKKTTGTMTTPLRESSAAPSGTATAAADAPRYTRKTRGAAVLSGGSGYRGSYLEGGTGTGSVLAAPVAERSTRRVRRGQVPLPSGYPLLPGDEELWSSLTPTQQQRAIQFLEDGSTIRSSLQAD